MVKNRLGYLFLVWALVAGPSMAQPASAETDTLDPVALNILQRMTSYLGSIQRFSFHTENSTESVMETGEKLQEHRAVDTFVRRPDRFRANINGDRVTQELYYDGSTVTLFGKRVNYYATMKAPSTLEGAINQALESFNLVFPLSDLFRRDSYSILTHRIQSGYYVGVSVINGIECDQLLFRGEEVDVQVWVEKGEKPLPRKLVLTSKLLNDSPQFEALITRWDVAPNLDETLFTFIPPKEAARIDFRPVE